MGNRMTRTVFFTASALLSIVAFGAGAARFGTLRNSDWVVTNAWQAVSNKTHDLILEMGQEASLPPNWQNVSNFAMNAVQSLQPAYDYTDNALISFSSTGIVFRSLSYGTPTRWTDATGCVWQAEHATGWVSTTSSVQNITAVFDSEYDVWNISFTVDGTNSYANVDGYETQTSISINDSWYMDTADGPVDGWFYFNIVLQILPAESTNLVGRVALTNDISQAISTNNSAFVSAVLAAPLVGADPSDLSELSEYGSYGTVGAALLALIAGLAALKRGKLDGSAAYPAWMQDDYQPPAIVSHKGRLWRCQNYTISEPGEGQQSDWLEVTIGDLKQDTLSSKQMDAVNSGATAEKVATWDGYAAQIAQKANADALPYALVTPGEWEFSDGGSHVVNGPIFDGEMFWYYTIDNSSTSQIFETEADALAALSLTFDTEPKITATRPSLPGHLLDRAGNRVVVSGDTTLTLPALVNAGKLRDFLVRLEISGSTVPTITFQGQGSEAPNGADEITYETDGDEFPVPDEAGTWLYSFTESCVAHKFAVSLKKVNTVAQGGA